MSSNNWQTTQPPKPKVVPIGDADTLLGQLQLANQSLTQVANPAPQNIRPESIPTMGWPIYIDSEWNINFVMFTSVTPNLAQQAAIKTMGLDGSLNAYVITLNYNTNLRQAAFTVFPAPYEGWLLSVELAGNNISGTSKRGEIYVQCYLDTGKFAQGSGGGQVGAATTLFNDYISTGYNPSWPNGRVIAPTEGPGQIYNAGVVPAVGAEISVAVPTGARWRLKNLNTNLTTAAGGGARALTLIIKDAAGNVFYATDTGTTTAAAGVDVYFAAVGTFRGPIANTFGGADPAAIAPLSDNMILPAGYTIQTSTVNLGASDQYNPVNLIVEEWLEP